MDPGLKIAGMTRGRAGRQTGRRADRIDRAGLTAPRARRYSAAVPSNRGTDWSTIALLGAMYAVLVGNHLLYWSAPLPLPLHILFSVAAIHCAFTVWHEAVHRNVSDRAWVNNVVGVTGMFPYMTPYFMQKWIHLEHHKQLNRREDPNFIYIDGPFSTIVFRYLRALRYAKNLLSEDPRTPWERRADTIAVGAVGAVFVVAWWCGVFWDVVLLWLLPVVIAKVIMDWYINYLPHVGLPADRFRGTRIVAVPWFTPLVLNHNYHAIHHLWPSIPWHRYPAVFRDKLDYLRQHGVPIEYRVLGPRLPAGELGRSDSVAR